MTDPGWYPDPQAPGQLRWWDGSTWTTHVATPTAGGPPAAAAAPPPGGPPYGPGPSQLGDAQPGDATPGAAQPGYGAPPFAAGVAPTAPPSGRRGLFIGLAVAAAVVLVVIALTIPFLVGRNARTTSASPTPPTTEKTNGSPTTERTGGSPTTAASGTLADNAERAGIPVLDEEGSATHTHTLLRITLDGDELVIPAGIGIDTKAGQITAVHTHEATGVLHVESPHRNDVYTVGQFLTLWGVGDSDEELCSALAEGPCQISVDVVAPTAADEKAFDSFGPMPATPPVDPDGLDTELAQGAVIVITLTTS